jgi:DNA repair ATPase RecN
MREPSHTCPTVDKLIAIVKEISGDLHEHLSELSNSDCEVNTREVTNAIDNLELIENKYGGLAEQIRSNNIELREWGKHWEKSYQDLEKDYNQLERQSEKQLADLEREKDGEIEKLYAEISRLEDQLQYSSTQTEL